MVRKAFVMTVHPGMHKEYEKRHGEIWPEMIEELRKHGASNYSLFLEKETNKLFGYVEIVDEEKWEQMAKTEINQKWWKFMSSIMETHPDHRPISVELTEVFHME